MRSFDAAARARATDGPKLQARRRICLPRTLAELEWEDGTELAVSVRGGAALLRSTGPGRVLTVNVGSRLYLPAGVVRVLGAEQGDALAAHVPAQEDAVVLYGPATTELADRLLFAPDHQRRLATAVDVDLAAAAALESLAIRLDGQQLAALAGLSVERLAELGLITGPEAH